MEISEKNFHSLYCDDINCLSKAHIRQKEEVVTAKARECDGESSREETLKECKVPTVNNNHNDDSKSTICRGNYREGSIYNSTDSESETDRASTSSCSSSSSTWESKLHFSKTWLRRWLDTENSEIYQCKTCNNQFQDFSTLHKHEKQCYKAACEKVVEKLKMGQIHLSTGLSAGASKTLNEESSSLSIVTTDIEKSSNLSSESLFNTECNPPQQPQPLKRPTIPAPAPNDHKIISVADFNPQSIGYRTTNRCPCPKCDLSFCNIPPEPHLRVVHNDAVFFTCGYCKAKISSELYFYYHLETMHNDFKKFFCSCGKEYIGLQNFAKHKMLNNYDH